MMNKGLEVIEAHYLFDVEYDQIKTILHRESVVHSLVELDDTTILAHIGHPDMRVPINYALSYPKRIPFDGKRLSLSELGSIHFEELSIDRYPLLGMAIEAGKKKGLYPCTMNAANEAAVGLFLDGKITFLEIEEIVKHCLDHFEDDVLDLEHLIQRDLDVKEYVIKTFS
jgi:1-deoxy-D-xylulose-5-phosphate reductoisomerase